MIIWIMSTLADAQFDSAYTQEWEAPLDLIDSNDHLCHDRPLTIDMETMPELALKTQPCPLVMSGPTQVAMRRRFANNVLTGESRSEKRSNAGQQSQRRCAREWARATDGDWR